MNTTMKFILISTDVPVTFSVLFLNLASLETLQKHNKDYK